MKVFCSTLAVFLAFAVVYVPLYFSSGRDWIAAVFPPHYGGVTLDVGDEFIVNVNVSVTCASIAGFEYKFVWNNTLLEVMRMETTPPWGGYFVDGNKTSELEEGISQHWVNVTSLSTTSWTGTACVCTYVFHVANEPVSIPSESDSCILPYGLKDTRLSDSRGNLITHYTYPDARDFYGLLVASTVVFALFGVLITLGLFRGGSKGFEGVGVVKFVFAVLVGVVVTEELLQISVFAAYGFAFSVLAFVLLPVFAVRLGRDNGWLKMALEAVALIFAIRLVLSPGFPFEMSVSIPITYTLTLVALVLYLTYRKISAGEIRVKLGRHGLVFQVISGLSVGAVIAPIEYLVLNPDPILKNVGFVSTFTYVAIVMLMVGVVEEMLFRGFLQCPLERLMPAWQAIGVTSVMFGLRHVIWFNPFEILLAYGAGIVFGCLAVLMDSLITPMVAHAFGNLVLYLIVFFLR